MPFEPEMKNRDAQSYVAIRTRLLRDSLGKVAPGLFAEVYEWVEANEITITGPLLIRYVVVDYNTGEVEVDVGAPVASDVPDHSRIHRGEIPGGTFATVIHQGPYTALKDTTAELLAWGETNHIQWQVSEGDKVTYWQGRVEHYLVTPPAHPNPADWRTEIAILLTGQEGENESPDA